MFVICENALWCIFRFWFFSLITDDKSAFQIIVEHRIGGKPLSNVQIYHAISTVSVNRLWYTVYIPWIMQTCRALMWGVLCQKQVSWAGKSNYIPQILWDVIICPCPWHLLLARHSRAGTSNYIPQILRDVITCPWHWHLYKTPHLFCCSDILPKTNENMASISISIGSDRRCSRPKRALFINMVKL